MSHPGRKMSLLQATMLVAGNMIGTGVFLLPVNLASVGGLPSSAGWWRPPALPPSAWSSPSWGSWTAGRRALRLRPTPRALRGFPDQLRLLVRQLDRQHRDRGGGGGVPGRVHSRDREAAGECLRHGGSDLALTFMNILGRALSGRWRPGP